MLRPKKAQRGTERPGGAQRSGAWIEQACRAFGWGIPTTKFTTREGGSPQADLRPGCRSRTVQNRMYRTVCTEQYIPGPFQDHSRTIPAAFPDHSRTRTEPFQDQNSTEQYRTIQNSMYVDSRTTTGAFPQAELRPGRLCTYICTHKQNYDWRN